MLLRRFLAHARKLRFLATDGDFLGDPFEHRLAVRAEAEVHIGLAVAARAFVGALLRVADVRAEQHRVVLEHEVAVRVRLRDLARRRFDLARLHDDRTRVHAHGLRLRAGWDLEVGVEVLFAFLGAAQDSLVRCVEEVPRAVDAAADLRRRASRFPAALRLVDDRQRGVVLTKFGWAFGRAQHRLVERQPELRRASVRAPRRRRFRRCGVARRADHVGLPVVEDQLRRLADLLFGAVRIRNVGERDGDFFRSRELDFGLRDAQLVDALAHDFDRAVERFAVDFRLRRRLALVGELHAALEVEPETRLFGDDRDGRDPDQDRHGQQHHRVARAVAHLSHHPERATSRA